MSDEEIIEGNVRRLRPVADEKAQARARLIDQLSAPADKSIRMTKWIAGGAFVTLFGLATFVPISSGVVANGQLATQLERQMIAHATGGIIKQVLVKEGQKVKAGDLLIKLEPAQENANAGYAGAQLHSLEAEGAVRSAEINGQNDVALAEAQDPATKAIIAAQKEAFAARADKRKSDRDEVDAQRAQIRAQIAGERAQQTSMRTQLEKTDQELAAYNRLMEAGLIEKTRVWATERSKADMEGRIAASQANVQRMQAQDRELAARRAQIELDARVLAAEDMGDIARDLAAAQPRFEAAEDALKRTEITAPMTGTVMKLSANTVGGVVRPGDTIMEIVPAEGQLVVRAHIKPQDADDVHRGLAATVRFDSVGSRYAPRLKGEVLGISADAMVDEHTGQSYFIARVAIPSDEAKRLPPGAYEPGLPAEVLIKTGSHTVVDYLMGPVEKTAFRAMREN